MMTYPDPWPLPPRMRPAPRADVIADLTSQLAACIGSLRGIADGLELAGTHPLTVTALRKVADEAMLACKRALQ